MEDIHGQLRKLEDQHVQAVRKLEKLAKVDDHIRAARDDLSALANTGGSNPSLHVLIEQLQSIEETLGEETNRTRAYILDIELDQNYLRRRLQGWEGDHPTRNEGWSGEFNGE
jgi:hypothetical protein